MQISQVMMSYTQPTFDQIIMIKKDISANLYLKCLILCSKILLNHCVPQYKRNSFVTMATYYNWVPDFPNIKAISGHLWHFFSMFANGSSFAGTSKHINMLARVLCPWLTFFKLKITNIYLKLSGQGLEKSELPWKHNFYSWRCVSCTTTCSIQWSALQIGQDSSFYLLDLSWVYDAINHLICMFYTFFKLTGKYLWN